MTSWLLGFAQYLIHHLRFYWHTNAIRAGQTEYKNLNFPQEPAYSTKTVFSFWGNEMASNIHLN